MQKLLFAPHAGCFSHSWPSLLAGWSAEGELVGGVGLHSFHWGCLSANQVTPSSVPGKWEGRISSVSILGPAGATQRQGPVCTGARVHAQPLKLSTQDNMTCMLFPYTVTGVGFCSVLMCVHTLTESHFTYFTGFCIAD